jgi:hypothetical protein
VMMVSSYGDCACTPARTTKQNAVNKEEGFILKMEEKGVLGE